MGKALTDQIKLADQACNEAVRVETGLRKLLYQTLELMQVSSYHLEYGANNIVKA